MSAWKSESIPHGDGDLFEAIVTAENGKQLIAQCTTLDFAKEIEDKHNRFDIELAQLRADLKAAQERIAQQAAQLEQARKILTVFCNQNHTGKELYTAYDNADAWLAANAQPVSAFAAIDKLMSEHPDLFKDEQQEQSA